MNNIGKCCRSWTYKELEMVLKKIYVWGINLQNLRDHKLPQIDHKSSFCGAIWNCKSLCISFEMHYVKNFWTTQKLSLMNPRILSSIGSKLSTSFDKISMCSMMHDAAQLMICKIWCTINDTQVTHLSEKVQKQWETINPLQLHTRVKM